MQLVDYTWNIRLVFSALRARGGDDRGTLRGHQSCKAQPHRDLRGFSRLKLCVLAGTRNRSNTSEGVVLPVWATAASVAPPQSFNNAAVCCYCSWTKAVSVGTLLSGVLVLEGAENNGYAERFVAVR
ncbi:hypothetical protein PF005_g6779 [Phytophthora fragariae]|uniref:Uncharacterized protein n=1 Tax=Phytophthora fragariae TaxID=53985 RepID=A0A6A3YRE3_9STRA|nr:hypothetical protein PF007_g6639 [Phytophthora fragariae]KAE9222198.1 hypothetical protein PF005_g6779 [Phytophthora fragariae]